MAEDKGKGGSPTIVGGQPPSEAQGVGSGVPVGVEELLSMAAVDPKFAAALQERPEQAIQVSGVLLTASERAILNSVGPASLGTMIAGVREVMPDEERREFLGHSAAAMLLLASGLGGTAASCDEMGMTATGSRPDPPAEHKYPAPTGARPDPPEPKPAPREPDMGRRPMETGSRPDEPPPKPHGFDSPKTGSRPDEPEPAPPKPDQGIRRPSPTRGIRPDRPRPPNRPPLSRGVRPDRPRPMPKSRGISPDLPDDEL